MPVFVALTSSIAEDAGTLPALLMETCADVLKSKRRNANAEKNRFMMVRYPWGMQRNRNHLTNGNYETTNGMNSKCIVSLQSYVGFYTLKGLNERTLL